MKTILVTWLSSAKGRFISLAVGLVIGLATTLLARFQLTLDPRDEALLTTLVTALVGWGLDMLVIKINSDGVKAIQAPLQGIKEDGVPGAKTIAAVEDLASKP